MSRSLEEKVVQITERTVLQVGGFRITIEPMREKPAAAAPTAESDVAPAPASALQQQLAAEAEMVQRTQIPFEGTVFRRAPRLSKPPVPGDKFSAGGKERVISRVVGNHGELWAVVDQDQVPAVLKREGPLFILVPPVRDTPAVGDVVFSSDGNFPITAVIAEAEAGGWAVRTSRDTDARQASHVICFAEGRWALLSAVTV
jgi:hypothetical protein